MTRSALGLGLAAGALALAAEALGRLAMPGALRAWGMLALPIVLVSLQRRADLLLSRAAGRARRAARAAARLPQGQPRP